jgi:hypothetical protein
MKRRECLSTAAGWRDRRGRRGARRDRSGRPGGAAAHGGRASAEAGHPHALHTPMFFEKIKESGRQFST